MELKLRDDQCGSGLPAKIEPVKVLPQFSPKSIEAEFGYKFHFLPLTLMNASFTRRNERK